MKKAHLQGQKEQEKRDYLNWHTTGLFLDEIGDSSTWIQSRLLRVLEERELMRLGDTKVIPVNVRVIVATNKNLKTLIERQLFREDLYYRLNVFPIRIPPLRERKECLFPLISQFMLKYNLNKTFSEEAYNCVMNYNWPGNVRELKNMVDYLVLQKNKNIIDLEDLPYDTRCSSPEKHSLSSNDIAAILGQLQTLCDLTIIRDILCVFKRNGTIIGKIGRIRMQMEFENHGIKLSDGKIRTIIDHLEAYDLIIKGKTKQGTVISSKGDLVLTSLDVKLA